MPRYEPARNVSKTYNEIDRMGQKTITGKMAISKEDYSELTVEEQLRLTQTKIETCIFLY